MLLCTESGGRGEEMMFRGTGEGDCGITESGDGFFFFAGPTRRGIKGLDDGRIVVPFTPGRLSAPRKAPAPPNLARASS